MRKMLIKLIAALLSVILAVTVAVMSSYAWLVLSESPTVDGIYIAVGGGNTILLAADVAVEENGTVYHFPGEFSDYLNFTQYNSYEYLKMSGGLTPVSTADGLNWYLPAYYNKNDEAVLKGNALNGQLKPIEDFLLDTSLQYANLKDTQTDMIDQGSYIFLDFWVVSPGADYQLHISTGDDSSGSFVIGLPNPEEIDTNGDSVADGYVLDASGVNAAASTRIGFLVNSEVVTDTSLIYYQRSENYVERYSQLQGVYSEQGTNYVGSQHRFLIYEPNGTLHPDSKAAPDGSYAITDPLGKTETGAVLADISPHLTVQTTNTWLKHEGSSTTKIEQMFETAFVEKGFRSTTLQELKSNFYQNYLQGQLAAYVEKGDFFSKTSNLYALSEDGVVSAETLQQKAEEGSIVYAGATDGAYIVNLERNVPQRIRMFIWLEGQDVDCTNAVRASGFAVNIELAGSSNYNE